MNGPGVIVVCGTQSGVGKTSICVGLIAALRRRGLTVQPFKVGPDFLDPTYLERAAGRPCYNLDGWMMGSAGVLASFTRHSTDADLCVVEGVMGLFDGADPKKGSGSTAEVATWLGAPVVLVVNAHGMSRSLAALVKGFSEFDPAIEIGGVILNRTGSTRHAAWIAESLAESRLPSVMGAVPEGALFALPSRHLGLVTADETTLTDQTIASLADATETYLDLQAILALAPRTNRSASVQAAISPAPRRVRIGLARDDAFHFYYRDNLEALEAGGAELVEFSPLNDAYLPDHIDLLYLGGGYPEVHAARLSANRAMCEAVRRHAIAGRPIYAECGGLLYLGESLDLLDGRSFKMAGVLPLRGQMRERRSALGYVEAELAAPSLLGPPGTRVRGHEFHYSEISIAEGGLPAPWSAAYRLRHRRSDAIVPEGFCHGDLFASYVHVHFASRPEVVDHMVERCWRNRERFQGRST